jgi:hypothetical protein
MRQSLRILLLTTLCTLFAVAAGLAQTPQTATAVPTVTQFLATLSATPGDVPGTEQLLPPSPKLASTVCTTNADCPKGQLCCYPCGRFGCDNVCMAVTTCPHFP